MGAFVVQSSSLHHPLGLFWSQTTHELHVLLALETYCPSQFSVPGELIERRICPMMFRVCLGPAMMELFSGSVRLAGPSLGFFQCGFCSVGWTILTLQVWARQRYNWPEATGSLPSPLLPSHLSLSEPGGGGSFKGQPLSTSKFWHLLGPMAPPDLMMKMFC